MAWIKFDKDLIDDPRILRAAEDLCDRYTVSVERIRGPEFSSGHDLEHDEQISMMRNAVTGALVTLWVYADTHIRNGDVLPISVTAIDRMVGLDGFCELLGEDWIQPSADGQSVVLPGYCEKNGLEAKEKRKTSNAERQRRFRQRHQPEGNAVTNATVTRLDQDRDLDHKTREEPPVDKSKTTTTTATTFSSPAWWKSNLGIEDMGKKLGMAPRPGEGFPEYKDRIFAHINAQKQAAKTA